MYSYVKEMKTSVIRMFAKDMLLLRTRSVCYKEYWFDAAQDAQIAANAFSIPIAVYSDGSVHESILYLPYDLPDGQPLPEIMHFVNGNHFQTIKTKRFPRMTWPPILPQPMAIWESRGRDQSEYKAAWKYIHRKKYPKITSTNGSSKQPIVIEDDDDKASSKDKVLEELREKLKTIEAIPVERGTYIIIDHISMPFCGTSLGDPMPEAIKKVYDEYVQKNEQYRKDREKEAVDKDTRFIQIRTITRDLQLTFQEQMNFCQVHKIELIYKPEAIEKGYPQDINFRALPERILPHLETLVEIAKGKLYSPFRDNEEAFFKENKRFVKRSVMARMSRMEMYTSGYYGIRGRDVMLRVLQRELLFTKKIASKDTKPLDEITFIQTILVPECSILLIQQDLDISYSEAYEILIGSHKYGNYTYNDVVDEDYDD
ncbi:RTC4-like domain-containing protein [Phascolomyces articulosus]|uniref:Restriction of telomere capping protein 4 n=1 Tax=Phascolomyces articulosus TaxID=60185 RepID=A0AAD5JL46_9FUNG|nr:RTC4-like domain-containing protein [Phascolomyces articulosus]